MSAVTLEDVERQIGRRAVVFRFQQQIERLFVEDYAANRSRLAPLWALIGLAMYLFQLTDDYNLTPDVFPELLVARVAIFAPGALIGLALVMRKTSAIRYDLLTLWTGVVGSFLPMVIASETHGGNLFTYQNGNVAALMFFVIVLRPRFPVALLGLTLMTTIHTVTMAGKFDDLTYSSILSFVLTAAVFMAAGAYYLEYTDRMNFLHRLRGTLLQDQLRYNAERDELTGLLNRRSLNRFSEEHWAPGKQPQAIAAILFDIDHFKLFNDRHGHVEGDGCLREVSRCVASLVGDRGKVFRYGGEEMLVLVPGVDLGEAADLAERIRHAIEALHIRNGGTATSPYVTASLGVAANGSSGTFDHLLERADRALYGAKHNGRNRIEVDCDDQAIPDDLGTEIRIA
ncbi:GGDEF domain-containing protein [Rhizobium alvei]|uniref:diguanylate cyclase n=1 Tax=Rhizobium alvei TaxID=1132659 RepID=A0ABT8YPB4_9HYPH|nr:GGDEF domain-containing protein [Rhizobium alvei]MDO6965539.1 GGDEF domain-containing protein [Rhizobium alvei]